MATQHPAILFFAGTDTDVGKTYCAALAARQLTRSGRRVGVYKPVASGCRNVAGRLVADDAIALWQAAGQPRSLDDVCPQRFLAPLAPPEAARSERRQVDRNLLRSGASGWETTDFDVLIVEGAGGLLSPLADGVLNIDLATQFRSPQLLIVAANRLGVIHQVLATCEAACGRGLTPAGIVLSSPVRDADPSVAGNAGQIARYCDVPIVGVIGHGEEQGLRLTSVMPAADRGN